MPPTLGRRGGGWVALQFALLAAVVFAGLLPPAWPGAVARALDVVGAAALVAGAGAGAWAVRALGRSLTPFPRPADGASLVESGPFGHVRHPIYGAGLLVVAGYALLTGPAALVPAAALAVAWASKAAVEERFLRERFPAYEAYARRVRRRLVPGVY